MAKKKTHIDTYKIISIILLLSTIVFIGLYFTKQCPVIEKECPEKQCPIIEEKALIFGTIDEWAENAYDSSEYLIGAYIYNFGKVEAKNTELTCNIYVGDEEGYMVVEEPVNSISKRIGNVASESFKYAEIELEKDSRKEGEYPLADCFITYCENCEILSDRIQEY